MFRFSWKIANVFGVPIRLHLSVFLVFLLIHMTEKSFLKFVLLSAGYLLSVAAHELGHVIAMSMKGQRIKELTLTFIGGSSQTSAKSTSPKDELKTALAGPVTSVMVCLFFLLMTMTAQTYKWPKVIEQTCVALTSINLMILVLFNLLPALPLDGGRILKVTLARYMGKFKATTLAVRFGKMLAFFFIMTGFVSCMDWLPMDNIYTLSLMLAGIFIYSGASGELRAAILEETMRKEGSWAYQYEGDNTSYTTNPSDSVIISPPPYEKGPAKETKILPDKQDHFRYFFI